MTTTKQKKLIFDFIRRYSTGVLATVSPETKSEAAVVSFAITDDFEVIFQTFTPYRKYRNLKNNPSVAFVFGWDEKITVQYDGLAYEIQEKNLIQCKELYFEQNSATLKWDGVPDAAWFKVSPKWIRYLDNTEPRTIHEITFP
jgi:general stress protein 26